MDIEVQYGEHCSSVDHEFPIDVPLCKIDGIEKCTHTLEEQNNNNP